MGGRFQDGFDVYIVILFTYLVGGFKKGTFYSRRHCTKYQDPIYFIPDDVGFHCPPKLRQVLDPTCELIPTVQDRYVPLPLHLPPLLNPVQPAPGVLARVSPPGAPRQLGRRPAAHPSLAIENHLGVLGRPRVSQSVFELLLADVEAVGLGHDGDVDCPWDAACILQLAWFACVCGWY